MKKNSSIIIGLIFIVLLAAPLLARVYLSWQEDHFSCENHLTIVDKTASYDIIMHFTFDGGEGKYESTVLFQQQGRSPQTTSNSLDFKYWREGGQVIMVAEENSEPPKNIDRILPHLPDFFHFKDRGMSVRIVPENDSGYMFIYENAPLFYCMRTFQHSVRQPE